MDPHAGAAGAMPRDALRGLPPATVRFLSNLCRELFEVGRKADRAERSAAEATSHGTDLWSTIESSLFQLRATVEGQLGQLQGQVDALADGQHALKQFVDRVARDTARKSAAADDGAGSISARQQALDQSLKLLKQEQAEIAERHDSCWRTVHHHTDLLANLGKQMTLAATETETGLDRVRQQAAGLEARARADSATLQHDIVALRDQLDHVARRLDLSKADADQLRTHLEARAQAAVESALEFEKTRRQDEIRLLIESTEQLKARSRGAASDPDRRRAVTDSVSDMMAVVNANAALFAERHAQTLDRCDALERILRVTGDKLLQLEGRVPSQLTELYETLTQECERRVRNASDCGRLGPAASRAGPAASELGLAATHTLQSQIDRLQERLCSETRHLRRSLESLCDALAQLSAEVDSRLRRCEMRGALDDLDGRVQRLDVSAAGVSRSAPSPRTLAHATRQVLHQRAVSRSRSARPRSHVPDSTLTAEGVTLQSGRPPPPEKRPVGEGAVQSGGERRDADLEQFAHDHPHIPSFVFTDFAELRHCPQETQRLAAAVRRQTPRAKGAARSPTSVLAGTRPRTPEAAPSAVPARAPAPPADEKLTGW